jgi:hypothetical protein
MSMGTICAIAEDSGVSGNLPVRAADGVVRHRLRGVGEGTRIHIYACVAETDHLALASQTCGMYGWHLRRIEPIHVR